MARDFNGTTSVIRFSSVANMTGVALSYSAWVWFDIDQSARTFSISDSADKEGLYVSRWAGGKLGFQRYGATNLYRETASSKVPTGEWVHLCVTHTGGMTDYHNILIYINGVDESVDASAQNGATERTLSSYWDIGKGVNITTRTVDGRIADPAVWNRVITTDEITALADGFSPRCFPNGLKWAPDLIRDIRDPVSGQAGTEYGTTVADHPRIIYPHAALNTFYSIPASVFYGRIPLSASSYGRPVAITATGSPGTIIHTVPDETVKDVIHASAINRTSSQITVTSEWGATGADNSISQLVDAASNASIIPGLQLGPNKVYRAYASDGSDVSIAGYVDRLNDGTGGA